MMGRLSHDQSRTSSAFCGLADCAFAAPAARSLSSRCSHRAKPEATGQTCGSAPADHIRGVRRVSMAFG
jgi:hypothetical protein